MQKPLSRRQFVQIIAAAGTAALTGKLALENWRMGKIVRRTRYLMGTVVNLTLWAPSETQAAAASEAADACLDHMIALEGRLSRFQPLSQISQLNCTGYLNAPCPELLYLVRLSQQISASTGGAFDITIEPLLRLYQHSQDTGSGLPGRFEIEATRELVGWEHLQVTPQRLSFALPGMAITLDGIAKGYIVDEGIQILRRSGYENVLVEAGGDLFAAGKPGDRTLWQVGVQSPRREVGEIIARYELSDQAMATSGDYMQPFSLDFSLHHILNPHTGFSTPLLASATVIAPNLGLADALATALMVIAPEDGLAMINKIPDCHAYLVGKDLSIYSTSGKY